MAELDEFQKLEQALIEAGRAIEYPPTPNLAARCGRTERRTAPDRPRQPDRPAGAASRIRSSRWRFSACHRLAAHHSRNARSHRAAAGPAHHPHHRDDAHSLHTQPEMPATATPARTPPGPSSTPGVVPFKQCCESTLAEAQQTAPTSRLLLPPDEQPSRVFFQDQVFGRGSEPQQVVLVFGDPDRPRFVLYQATRYAVWEIDACPATAAR